MINRINLRVNGVNTNELSELHSLIGQLNNKSHCDEIVSTPKGMRDFVITLKPATIGDIKDTLHAMLQIVSHERIAIET